MDPRTANAKATLNARVKEREAWRPYAASVLETHAADCFEIRSPSPYMLQAVKTKESIQDLIPAVVHRDGTCRIQTVNAHEKELDSFANLLSAFHAISGLPLMLNTSLNTGGAPISGEPSQSLKLLNEGRIDALCVGDKLIINAP